MTSLGKQGERQTSMLDYARWRGLDSATPGSYSEIEIPLESKSGRR